MTDTLAGGAQGATQDIEKARRLRRRYGAERRFRFLGLTAIILAISFLVVLLATIVTTAWPALRFNYLILPGIHSLQTYGLPAQPAEDDLKRLNFDKIVRDSIRGEFPYVEARNDRQVLARLMSVQAPTYLRQQILSDETPFSAGDRLEVPFSDFADLYLKGQITDKQIIAGEAGLTLQNEEGIISGQFTSDVFESIMVDLRARLDALAQNQRMRAQNRQSSVVSLKARLQMIEAQIATAEGAEFERLDAEFDRRSAELRAVEQEIGRFEQEAMRLETMLEGDVLSLAPNLPSVMIMARGATIKVQEFTLNSFKAEAFIPIDPSNLDQSWQIQFLETPEADRKFTDKEIAYTDQLVANGFVREGFNAIFFTRGDSREAEMAGVWGAVVGSFYTLLVTLVISFPVGVAAAIYLEEFAPKNRLTTIIEVNINNLAAVPSIVFGLLGLAVFLNFFKLDRGVPYVGGMVLSLMTLPTIIIASRAALRAVPPSIREAALGIGASRIQTAFHHVLPLAMPGILTGSIIGMAQALGETAPLLMIGMVAFVADIPGSIADSATVLPVQIFLWADAAEPAFVQKTSLAIMVLLGFLILMNSAAVFVRKAFERRW